MSFRVSGYMHNPIKLNEIADRMTVGVQAAAAQAAREGLDFLRSNTPRETDALVASEQSGSNQSSIWFQASVQPRGDGRPYGPAQNYGWHTRGGGFKPGDFFMERTQEYAAERLQALIALTVMAQGGSLGMAGGVGFAPEILMGAIGRIVSIEPGSHDLGEG